MFKTTGKVFKLLNNAIRCSSNVFTLQTHAGSGGSKKVLGARFLYSKSSLGLDSFEQQRERTKLQLSNLEDKFKERMLEYTKDDKNMIFTEDLKNMIHLASTDDEASLVIEMLKRFNNQNEQLRFGTFKFGPVVMRLFHVLNKPNLAIECFKNEEFSGLFDQLITYQVFLDLLYENGMYKEVLANFKAIQDRQVEGALFPRNSVVIALAACYKLNNEESLDYALNLWKKLEETGYYPTRRAVTFCAALVLNQGKPEVALEMISNAKNQNYTTVRNLKVLALAKMGRLEDVIPILKSVLTTESSSPGFHTFNKDVMEKIAKSVDNQSSVELTREFDRIQEMFIKHGHVSEKSLDEQLCSEIQNPPNTMMNNKQFTNNQRFQQGSQRNFQTKDQYSSNRLAARRPGLKDLV